MCIRDCGRAFRRTPFDVPLCCFAALGALSVTVSADAAFSFYNYHQLMGRYLLVYYLFVQNVATARSLRLSLIHISKSARHIS